MNVRRMAAAGALGLAMAAGSSAIAEAETVTVLAKALDNPRHVALSPDGATVYVASAGKAGTQCQGKGEEEMCFGMTSRVLSVPTAGGAKGVVARGFLSIGARGGLFSTGLDGVAVRPDGRVMAVETSGPPEAVKPFPAAIRAQAGRLFDVTGGARTEVADVSAFEWANNADKEKGDRNSNPYAVLALADRTIVVDAGANAVLSVDAAGAVSLLAVIPKQGKNQAVPSSIALGPDGSFYVGELAEGAGKGKARVWKVPAAGGPPTLHASGFTMITGLAFGPDGSLFVTEMATNPRAETFAGDVVRLGPDGARKRLGTGKLVAPQGAAVDAAGNVYVSNFSVLPSKTPKKSPFKGAGGQVVKITP